MILLRLASRKPSSKYWANGAPRRESERKRRVRRRGEIKPYRGKAVPRRRQACPGSAVAGRSPEAHSVFRSLRSLKSASFDVDRRPPASAHSAAKSVSFDVLGEDTMGPARYPLPRRAPRADRGGRTCQVRHQGSSAGEAGGGDRPASLHRLLRRWRRIEQWRRRAGAWAATAAGPGAACRCRVAVPLRPWTSPLARSVLFYQAPRRRRQREQRWCARQRQDLAPVPAPMPWRTVGPDGLDCCAFLGSKDGRRKTLMSGAPPALAPCLVLQSSEAPPSLKGGGDKVSSRRQPGPVGGGRRRPASHDRSPGAYPLPQSDAQ